MRDDTERVSSSVAATPQPGWDSVDDRSAAQIDGNVGDESVGLPKEKKPYRKPTYRFEKVFETMALSCGKIHGVGSQCHYNRHTS
jgi:hypothetical protein